MSTTALYIAAGALLGLVQFGLGTAIGLWIRRTKQSVTDDARVDEQRARELLSRIGALTQRLGHDVNGHHSHIAQLNERLVDSRKASYGPLTELVVGVVGEVLQANEQLQEKLSAAETQLQHQAAELTSHLSRAMTDQLTGLPNRRAFDQQLLKRIEGYRRTAIPFSLMLIDIDHFKRINDTRGHIVGDRVLCAIADKLRTATRKPDFVGRYGGEEFVALLPYTCLEDAVHAAEAVRLAVQATKLRIESDLISVTASTGLTIILDGDDATTIVQRADNALYASKSGGRNCGYVHDGNQCVRIGGNEDSSGGSEQVSSARDRAPHPEPDTSTGESLTPALAAACEELRDCAAGRPEAI